MVTSAVHDLLRTLASALKRSVQLHDDFGLCLVLLNAWGLRVRSSELGLLSRVGLFATIQVRLLGHVLVEKMS